MVRAIEQSGVRPVIDRVFRFGDVPAAYAHLSGAGHFGKVVIDFERD
jgi:NADPH:quinone reductase-like Zn-dependent oxidoreductase